MRAFVGLPLPALEPVVGLLDELRRCGADLKVVEAENLHTTLKFLGEIPDLQATAILERLRGAGFPTGYEVRVRGTGAFPDAKKLNVLWVGLEDAQGIIARTFALSERVFAELGFPTEARPFAPHVTVARKRSDRGRDAAREVIQRHRQDDFGVATLHGPVLFRSVLTPQGPRYEVLGGVA